jgi:excisionase family DNA binding protein
MQTCNLAKTTTNNGISLESFKNSKGQSVMPTTDKVTPIRGDDLTLVDNKQAADILGVNYLTLQNWRSTGKSPRYVKVGRNVRYRISELKAWLEAQTRNHTGEVA